MYQLLQLLVDFIFNKKNKLFSWKLSSKHKYVYGRRKRIKEWEVNKTSKTGAELVVGVSMENTIRYHVKISWKHCI